MTQPSVEEIVAPDISHIVTEDDMPVDNFQSEKQQRFLVEPLYSSWSENLPFVARCKCWTILCPKARPDRARCVSQLRGRDADRLEQKTESIVLRLGIWQSARGLCRNRLESRRQRVR